MTGAAGKYLLTNTPTSGTARKRGQKPATGSGVFDGRCPVSSPKSRKTSLGDDTVREFGVLRTKTIGCTNSHPVFRYFRGPTSGFEG